MKMIYRFEPAMRASTRIKELLVVNDGNFFAGFSLRASFFVRRKYIFNLWFINFNNRETLHRYRFMILGDKRFWAMSYEKLFGVWFLHSTLVPKNSKSLKIGKLFQRQNQSRTWQIALVQNCVNKKRKQPCDLDSFLMPNDHKQEKVNKTWRNQNTILLFMFLFSKCFFSLARVSPLRNLTTSACISPFWFLHFHRGKNHWLKRTFADVLCFSFCCNSVRWSRFRRASLCYKSH